MAYQDSSINAYNRRKLYKMGMRNPFLALCRARR